MQFLILRGHNRLIPQGGLAEFPDAILNAKRLDLFNLYREVSFAKKGITWFLSFIFIIITESGVNVKQVVSRGGFHVGNGINWKGQVFSKMRNHTVTNRMTVCSMILFFITPSQCLYFHKRNIHCFHNQIVSLKSYRLIYKFETRVLGIH